jgi:biotin carboxylase
MKCLWIVGGGIESIPTVRRAKDLGLFVAVSDGNAQCPAFAFADLAVVANTYDPELTAFKAVDFDKMVRPVDGVIAASADVPRTVAAVSAALGLPGISQRTAELAADKLAMKNHLRDCGIPVPDFWEVASVVDVGACVKRAGGRAVIKPVDSRGARGVLLLGPDTDLGWAFEHARMQSPTARVMCEAFISGPQLSTESILLDNAALTPAVADRNYARLSQFAPYIIEDGGTQPSFLAKEQRLAVAHLAEDAARALGITTGTAKGDLVMGQQGPMVIEMAARLSGGWFATDQIPLHSGVDFVGIAIRLALGERVQLNEAEPKQGLATAIRYFFPPPGVVEKVELDDAMIAEPWVRRFQLDLTAGSKVPAVTDHTRRAGFALVVGDTREEAVARVERLIDSVKVTVSPIH